MVMLLRDKLNLNNIKVPHLDDQVQASLNSTDGGNRNYPFRSKLRKAFQTLNLSKDLLISVKSFLNHALRANTCVHESTLSTLFEASQTKL